MTENLFADKDGCIAAMLRAAETGGEPRTKFAWGDEFGLTGDEAYAIAYKLRIHTKVIVRPNVEPYEGERIVEPTVTANRNASGKEYTKVSIRLGKRDLTPIGDGPYIVRRVGNSLVIEPANPKS